MKKTITIFMIIFFATFTQAQTNNYESLWKEIAQFEKEGLTKSALKAVELISAKAKADKNAPQIIKTLLYKSKYALILKEDAQLKIINDFKKEINESVSPTKNVLENMLANLYWQYFNQNRYQFYNRTKTEDKVDTTDFRTWDLQTLFTEINTHYQHSLENSFVLQKTSLNNYEALLLEQKNSKIFRPTLYDLLSHNALEFYKTTENSITKPAYKFEIDNEEYSSKASVFSKLKITSKDSTSLQLQALKIYQKLIQFHNKDKAAEALADVNLERLKYVKEHATFKNKEAIYLKALQAESKRLNSNPVSGLYDFEIATLFVQQAGDYQPEVKVENRWKNKEALALCNTVLKQFPKSIAAQKCEVLKQQILQQTLQITTESYVPIQKDARFLVRYKNVDALSFVVYTISENQFEKLNKTYKKEEQLALINNLEQVTKWQSTLRNEQDYQTHTTEVILPKLINSRYVILATPNNTTNTFGFATIQVTNLAVVENAAQDKTTFQVIDRNNGKPIAEAKLKITYLKNNNRTLQTENVITNSKGEAVFYKEADRYRSVKIEVTHQGEKAYFGDYYIYQNHYNNTKDKETYKGFLFTDRSIYRPGQTVFFKGIAIKTNNDVSEVFPDAKLNVRLTDANGQEVKTLKFVTNAFGSIQGEFILPNTGLTGDFHIRISSEKVQINGITNISVEEYKRPKFEAKFLPITETYKVNDEITIKGNALAYAGSNITDAKVVYRVHRKVQYPRWYYWYRPFFTSEPQEIKHGESKTNDKGEFEIKFNAQPDQSVDKKNLPVFHYEVTADITDLNGETRSATTTVNVGYHALLANLSIADKLDKNNKDHTLKIDTKNLNGQFAPAKGTIKIYKLEAPQQVLRPRPWAAPDYQDISESKFKNKFPHEAYKKEHNSTSWKKGTLVLDEKFDTSKKKELDFRNIKKWESGAYVILLESKDKFGQEVKDEIKTTLFSDKDKTLADKQLFSVTTNKETYHVGETAIVTFASAAQDVYVSVSVEKGHKIIQEETIHLNNNKKKLRIPINKEDVGGFVLHYSFSAFNSYQSASVNIIVPYAKTALEIETLTFRDKLQPGTNETWSFKIKGPQGEKVSAELLASMYDASLDQFKSHTWNFNPITQQNYYTRNRTNARQSFGAIGFRVHNKNNYTATYSQQNYDQLDWFGFYFGHSRMLYEANNMMMVKRRASQQKQVAGAPVAEMIEMEEMEEALVVADALDGKVSGIQTTDKVEKTKDESDFSGISIRKNLQETAFFFPQLQTDTNGNISFSFTTPEALTKWNLQLLAHTKNLESTVTSLETVTQKELMVIPNAPRFLREGDEIVISSKIANLTEKQISGEAVLQLFDATTGERIDKKLFTEAEIPSPNYSGTYGTRAFTVDAKGNTQVSWLLYIPEDITAVQYKIIAKSEAFSDGEQNALPVLSNRMLVTETLPMWIKSNQTKTFILDKLKNNHSTTLKNHNLALEMTSNPAWYAVQALPYLMEYPYDCNEQTFSRYYANALASHITNSNPRIQEVFNQWKNTDALLSNLEKNEELKSLLIQETPWLRDAQSETEQKKRIALLFNLNKMNNELQAAKRKLEQNQMQNGAWSWFAGGRENRYITQHIITGFGHLSKLGVTLSAAEESQKQIIEKAIDYLDAEFVQEYKDIKKYNNNIDLTKDHLSYTQLHYLYMRSFFPEIKKSKEVQDITNYYKTQIEKYWLSRSLYAKGMMALVSERLNANATAKAILKSLKENSITSEALGMYWKENTHSWYWYQAPIETQALLIEAFAEIENDTKTIDNLKIWLLKNKQTNRWKTTKATTEAVYALLLQGSDWLSVTEMVNITIGNQELAAKKLENVKVEAGTGYFKTSWKGAEIKPEMAEVKITKKGKGIAWGSLYWQYFEDLDKITTAETPLQLKKKLFLKKNTDLGEELQEVSLDTKLQIGDVVRVRIELRSDRNMEFVHMKDMRAAGLEPINVLSKYKWQDGLGYYESTKDAATNFFFDYLPKGVFVFEYDLRVNNSGYMSNGITTIQSMYAPEFSSHSEGVKITVE
ncbi:alpha-2-macroglobulin [Lacinutrix sp. C3R15]|uniref:alpha-2-macroglobulin family protein n=1 Tax=Flavobacteriaceae TaxID=49546 RepID=UPI001C09A007|nr:MULTISPECIES: MG2 domain-containing protein [Flavobacteriaceae]MBU2939348.1 alpha-2-macroglobulin [Lacinutrix sp. C3R15]MDO6622663.1 MG2 domain-containing protein [Oceanihabitans sp. 1_MG-2023]